MAVPIEAPAGVVYTKSWTVEIILDLAGYTSDRRLADLVALEPAAGDGAFLRGMVRRLVESCRSHKTPIEKAENALQAFEIDPASAEKAVEVVRAALSELNVPSATATKLARSWIKTGDFLEAALGFPIADFVIGNPPYIRLEQIPVAKAQLYRNAFSTMRGRADIYVAFYEAALRQLKPGGVCAYICADRWLLNDYGSALRSFITTGRYNLSYVIETHDVQAFEAEVSAYPAITIISNEPQGSVIVAKALPGIETATRHNVVGILRQAGSNAVIRSARFETWFNGEEPWPCSSPERLRVLKEIEASCRTLEDEETGTKIGIGVATGADRIYVVDKDPGIEKSRLLPMAMADDLVNGRVQWSGHYLVNPWQADGLVDLADFPKFKAYLEPHKEQLSKRHTAKNAAPDRWHKTIDRVNFSLFKKEKLYVADIKDRLLPTLDRGETYPHHNLYWITSEGWDMRTLGGLLISEVGEFFIHCYGVKMRGGYYRFQAQYLRRIRVPNPKTIHPEIKRQLQQSFDNQNAELATKAALEAYKIDSLP